MDLIDLSERAGLEGNKNMIPNDSQVDPIDYPSGAGLEEHKNVITRGP